MKANKDLGMCDYLSDKFKMTEKKALKKSFLMDIKKMEKLSKVWFPELECYVKNNEHFSQEQRAK